MIRNIIFDWSGTLVDDLPAVWRATNFVFAQAGRAELTLDQFRAEFCLPFQQFYDRFTPDVSMVQLETWFHGHYRQVQDSVVELPHAREFLEFCRRHQARLFVLSSVHPEHYAVQVALTGFAEFIEQPYVGVWDKRAMIHRILEEHHLAQRETLFIGDMAHDIETARHGGVYSCPVLTGYNRLAQLRASEPDLVVEHLGELQIVLQQQHWELESKLPRQPVATVGALIFNADDQVLMIRTHKWSDLWGIPGGKIKFGEGSLDALRRELREETNLDVTAIELVAVQDCIHSREFYRDAHFVLLNYVCRAEGTQEVRLNEEAKEFRWLTVQQALALPLNQPTKRLLEIVRHPAHPSIPHG